MVSHDRKMETMEWLAGGFSRFSHFLTENKSLPILIIFVALYAVYYYIFVVKDDVKNENSEHINLKVTGQDGSVVHFKIKKNTPLRKLMSAYCDRAGLKLGVVRFRFDGNPINETDTPCGLDMEDGDSIDVFQQQTGGCHRN